MAEASTDEEMAAVTETMIPSGPSRLAVRSVGEGPDVVFVHGWPLHRETWRNVVEHLDGYRCHLIDNHGTGRSETPAGADITLVDGFSSGIVDVVDALGIDRFHLVGHDSGGLIARYVAASQGERVQSLVVTGSEIPDDRPWQLRMFDLMGKAPFTGANLRLALRFRPIRHSPIALAGAFADKTLLDGEFHELFTKPLVEDRALMAHQVRLLRSFGFDQIDALAEIHTRITAPTLLIWGSDDPFFGVDEARAMLPQFAGAAELVTIDGGKLFVHEEFPERFAELCADHFATATTVSGLTLREPCRTGAMDGRPGDHPWRHTRSPGSDTALRCPT